MQNQPFETIRIGDLGQVITGKTPPTVRPELFGDDYPFITPTDIDRNSRLVETERFLSEEGRLFQKKLLLPKGTVCFTCIGATIGKICITNQPSFTNQQINSIVVDQAHHDELFVCYLMKHNAPRVKAIAGGAATPIVSKSAFCEIEVTVPPLPIQHKIAGVLSAYDDLIEVNTRRISILEQMAQSVYREWFGKVDDKSLPDEWKIQTMQEVAEVIDCLHTKKPSHVDNGVGILLQLNNIGENGKLDLTKKFLLSKEDYILWTSRIEASQGDCVVTNVGRVAAVAQIPVGIKAALGRNMTGIRPKVITPTYLIEFLFNTFAKSRVKK